jgi:hypothetical protein
MPRADDWRLRLSYQMARDEELSIRGFSAIDDQGIQFVDQWPSDRPQGEAPLAAGGQPDPGDPGGDDGGDNGYRGPPHP